MPGTFYTFFKWVYFLQHPRELNIIISTSWMRGLFFCSQYSISLLEKLLERFCFSLKQIHLLNPMLHFTKFCTIIWHSVLVPSTGNCFFLLASMLAHSSTFLTFPSPLLSKRIPFSFCLILWSLYFSLCLSLSSSHTGIDVSWTYHSFPALKHLHLLSSPPHMLSPHTSAWLTNFIEISAQIALLSLLPQDRSEFSQSAFFFFFLFIYVY